MNCATHKDTHLQYKGTIAGIYVCPKCVAEHYAVPMSGVGERPIDLNIPIDPSDIQYEDDRFIIEIPWSAIKISELNLFNDPIVDGDKKVVIVRERI